MKQKKYFILAAAAALFAACSSDDIAIQEQATQPAQQNAVSFDVYTQRGMTRAGVPGSVTTLSLQTGDHKDAGFGVFGYYTDNTEYTQYATPNFFYNQQVKWNTGVTPNAWTYSPVKFWPNEFGTSAISDDVDKVTFFAYAPWVDVTPSSGKPADMEANITQISKNTATGDPIIKYVVDTNPDTSVDLLWGVVNDPNDYLPVDNVVTAPTLTEGLPFIDMVKEAVSHKIKFRFNHALAKLNVQIDAIVDEFVHSTTAPSHLDANTTRIYVRSITIGGFALKGALNLNNTSPNEPLWYDYDGTKELSASDVTFFDGRKDGKEATANGEQKSEKPATLNTNIIQAKDCFDPAVEPVLYTADEAAAYNATLSGAMTAGDVLIPPTADLINTALSTTSYNAGYTLTADDAAAYNATLSGAKAAGDEKTAGHGAQFSASANPGVTETPQNLFSATAGADDYFFVIPTGDDMNITIVYDVETVDGNLAGTLADGVTHGSSIENRIYKESIFTTGIEAGKQYQLKLHLGMTSVKFDATVTDWDEQDSQDVDLPYNGLTLNAEATTTTQDVWVDAATTTYEFQVVGLGASAWVTYTPDGTQVTALTGDAATTPSGKVIATATLAENKTIKDITTGTAKVEAGGKSAQVNFKQRAHALGLTVTGSNTSPDLTLGSSASNITWTDITNDADHIKVWKNGTPMIFSSTAPSGNQFQYDSSNNKIILSTSPATDDKFKVYIQGGDAEAETVEITI